MNSVIVSCASCGKKNKVLADKQHLQPKCGHCAASINLTNKAVPVELTDHNFHEFVKKSLFAANGRLFLSDLWPMSNDDASR